MKNNLRLIAFVLLSAALASAQSLGGGNPIISTITHLAADAVAGLGAIALLVFLGKMLGGFTTGRLLGAAASGLAIAWGIENSPMLMNWVTNYH